MLYFEVHGDGEGSEGRGFCLGGWRRKLRGFMRSGRSFSARTMLRKSRDRLWRPRKYVKVGIFRSRLQGGKEVRRKRLLKSRRKVAMVDHEDFGVKAEVGCTLRVA